MFPSPPRSQRQAMVFVRPWFPPEVFRCYRACTDTGASVPRFKSERPRWRRLSCADEQHQLARAALARPIRDREIYVDSSRDALQVKALTRIRHREELDR